MKALERPAPPPCLAEQDYRQGWGSLGSVCKRAVRQRLADEMQRGLCAYCERELGAGAHIEHFARRWDHPQRTFVWSNLFMSCGDKETCGLYKDRPRTPEYDPAGLADPCAHDPHDCLLFRESGVVEPHPDGRPDQGRRGQTTIDVFNLDHRLLRRRRAQTLAFFRQREPGFMEALVDCPPDEKRRWLEEELAAIDDQNPPCAASLRAFLRGAMPR